MKKIRKIQWGIPQKIIHFCIFYTLQIYQQKQMLYSQIIQQYTAIHKDPNKASKYLQNNLNPIQNLLNGWRFKANEIVKAKSNRVTCTRIAACPVVYLNGIQIPWAEVAKYFGIYFHKQFNQRKHKRKHLGFRLSKIYWLLGRNSHFTLLKMLRQKTMLKSIWTYNIQFCVQPQTSTLRFSKEVNQRSFE